MTKQRAISHLKDISMWGIVNADEYKALKMAIQALEQEPSEEYKRGWYDAITTALKETHNCYTDDGVFRVIQEESLVGVGMSMQEPKTGHWISCKERLPKVEYDYLGNWQSEEVILLLADEFMTVCNGHFNPVGVFEVYEEDGPATIGNPVEHVIAWMPLPTPYKESEDKQ